MNIGTVIKEGNREIEMPDWQANPPAPASPVEPEKAPEKVPEKVE